tara:strand:- start:805 stop:996 length:192 start_codon:yes stop_codon:yes gene_type:complete
MQGLGDTIAAIMEATGVKSVVKAIAGDDCGCDARQQKLNELFPYGKSEKTDGVEQEVYSETEV